MNFVRNLVKFPLKVQCSIRSSSLQGIRSTSFHTKATCWEKASTETKEITPAATVEQDEELDKLYRVVEVEVRGHDPAVLKSYSWFATTAANELGITVGNCWVPRKPHHDRMTLLKSVFIFKKHRVQYEMRTYFRFMQFLRITGSTADTFLEYIQRNLPEGVSMKVTKSEITSIPSHIRAPVGKKPQKLLSKPG